MSKTVMVVDDSIFIWEEIKHTLRDTDFTVVGCAKSGEECLQLYEKCNPDLVTMDIILPGMDGIEASKLLLEKHPDANIVMMSSLAYDETMEEAKTIGAKAFIFKPFEPQEMLTTLNNLSL